MRVLMVPLLLMTACSFRVEGTTPPPLSGTVVTPSPDPTPTDPGTPSPTDPGLPSDPTGTPTPPPPDMTTTPSGPGAPPPPPHGADMAPLKADVGKACASDGDCDGDGLKCMKTLGHGIGSVSLPGGYCSKACDAKTPCPTGSECISTLFGDLCLEGCTANSCRAGYTCCDGIDVCGLDNFCKGS
jgi:hypothetical protein